MLIMDKNISRHALAEQLVSRLDNAIALCVAEPYMWSEPVFAAEEQIIQGATFKRQTEFRAGRHCAHSLLNQLGYPDFALLKQADRQPLWPSDVVGSISHTQNFCMAACASAYRIKLLGLDVENNLALDDDILDSTHHAAEKLYLAEHPVLPARLIFSIKESIFKCLYPQVKKYFDFLDVDVALNPEQGSFTYHPRADASIRLPDYAELRGYFVFDAQHLISVCYVAC